jgi:hypothetical protein
MRICRLRIEDNKKTRLSAAGLAIAVQGSDGTLRDEGQFDGAITGAKLACTSFHWPLMRA